MHFEQPHLSSDAKQHWAQSDWLGYQGANVMALDPANYWWFEGHLVGPSKAEGCHFCERNIYWENHTCHELANCTTIYVCLPGKRAQHVPRLLLADAGPSGDSQRGQDLRGAVQ